MNDYGPKRFKRWGGVSPVGESQFQALENVDAPYLTIIGPGFEARKKGLFRELITTQPEPDQALLNFRASELVSSGLKDIAGTFSPDGSLRISTSRKQIRRVRRTDESYFPTCDWVSADRKYRVSWVSPSRYPTPFENLPFGTGPVQPQYFTGVLSPGGWRGWKATLPLPFTDKFWLNGVEYTAPGFVLGACVAVREEAGEEIPFVVIVGRNSLPASLTTSGTFATVDTVPDAVYTADLDEIPAGFVTRAIPMSAFNQIFVDGWYRYRSLLTNWHFNQSGTQAVACKPGTRGYTLLNIPAEGSVAVTMVELPRPSSYTDSFTDPDGQTAVSIPFTRTTVAAYTEELVWAADFKGDVLNLLTTRTEFLEIWVSTFSLGAFNSTTKWWTIPQTYSLTRSTETSVIVGGNEVASYTALRDVQSAATTGAGGSGPDGTGTPITRPVDIDILAFGIYETQVTSIEDVSVIAWGVDLRKDLHAHDVLKEVTDAQFTGDGLTTDGVLSATGSKTLVRRDRVMNGAQTLVDREIDKGSFPLILLNTAPPRPEYTGYDLRDLSRLQVSSGWDAAQEVGLVSIYSDEQDWFSPLDARDSSAYWLRVVDGVMTAALLPTYTGKVLHGVCVVKTLAEGRL